MFLDNVLVVIALDVRFHGMVSWFPVGRADFSVSVNELEGLDQSDVLVWVSPDGKVIDGKVSNDTVLVDDGGGSESNSAVVSFFTEGSI